MWTYRQRTGEVLRDGRYIATGYSGHDDGYGIPEPGERKNDPSKQEERGIGPLPVGRYKIGQPFTHPTAGVLAMRLVPLAGTNTFGRSGFLIHGDSIKMPGSASRGCVVLSRPIRRLIAQSVLDGDDTLTVESGEAVRAAVA